MRISDWSSDVCSSDLSSARSASSSLISSVVGAREVASGSLSVDGSGVEAGVGGATPSTGAASGFDVDFFPPISRSEEHTSELQSLMRISYAVFCLKKKTRIIHKQKKCEQHVRNIKCPMLALNKI